MKARIPTAHSSSFSMVGLLRPRLRATVKHCNEGLLLAWQKLFLDQDLD